MRQRYQGGLSEMLYCSFGLAVPGTSGTSILGLADMSGGVHSYWVTVGMLPPVPQFPNACLTDEYTNLCATADYLYIRVQTKNCVWNTLPMHAE